MSRKLKVYGVNLDGRYRGVVAATSRNAAAKALGVSPYHMANFGGETGNAIECELAMREPGRPWKTKEAYARADAYEPLVRPESQP